MTMPTGTEALDWITAQPKNPDTGKVDGALLIAEGQRRGYCVCPKPMREMINFDGMTCAWCRQPETRDSWRFWYEQK